MRTKLLLVLLSGFSLSAIADEPKTQLVVWAKDGTQVAYALENKPKVTFTDTEDAHIIREVQMREVPQTT